jgi:hypothetical protein
MTNSFFLRMGDRARQVAERDLINEEQFNTLYRTAQALVNEQYFEEGVIKLRQARLYVKPDSADSRKLEILMGQGEREIRSILEIEAEWFNDK